MNSAVVFAAPPVGLRPSYVTANTTFCNEPGRNPLIIRGKLFRRTEPPLCCEIFRSTKMAQSGTKIWWRGRRLFAWKRISAPLRISSGGRMVRRRAIAAGIMAPIGNRSFRATGILFRRFESLHLAFSTPCRPM
jgi:hypothetical protein